jgi:hypothetical protein
MCPSSVCGDVSERELSPATPLVAAETVGDAPTSSLATTPPAAKSTVAKASASAAGATDAAVVDDQALPFPLLVSHGEPKLPAPARLLSVGEGDAAVAADTDAEDVA